MEPAKILSRWTEYFHQVRKEMEELAENMELGNVKDYERLFTNYMLF